MGVQYNPGVVTDGLVLCLDPADKVSYGGTGTVATDLSGEGNTGTLTNANVGTTAGGIFSFDSSQYITVADGADFTFGTAPFAIEQWLNFVDLTPDGDTWVSSYQVYRIESDRHGIMVFYTAGGGFEWRLECSENGCYPAIIDLAAQGLAINEWHLFTVSRQSEASFKQYIDGVLIQEMTTADGGTAPRGQTYDTDWGFVDGTVFIGDYASADHHEFEGKMGPTRVYKGRALSDAEVLQNFNAQRGRFGV